MNRVLPLDKQRIRSELINRWNVAQTRLATSAEAGHRFASVPMSSACGVPGLAAALVVDSQARAVLLPGKVPGGSAAESPRGAALVFREQELADESGVVSSYIAVYSVHDRWNDLFCEFAVDVIVHVRVDPTNAVSIIKERVEHWRSFINPGQERETPALTREKETGLFGELVIMRALMEMSDQLDPARHWTGPKRHHHDYSFTKGAVEVKSTVSVDSLNITINGERQLDAPDSGPLALAHVRLLENGPRAVATSRLALSICDVLADPLPFLDLLQSAGMNPSTVFSEEGHAACRKFETIDIQWCFVDDRIPRIIPSSFSKGEVPAGVADVKYTTSLSGADWWMTDAIQENVASMLETE